MKISVQLCHAQMVGDGAFSHIIDWIKQLLEILNLKDHQSCIMGSKHGATMLNGWVLAIG